jgi:UDP-3-O-[3-hydroxymyristoyl] N-acetylglucosamine deacetylase
MRQLLQRTLRETITCTGIGLHSGARVNLTLGPAPAGTGIVFVRTDLPRRVEIPARADAVVDTQLATTLGKDGARVGTVEHLMAALFGLGIDNCRVELDGPEVPIMDGSAGPFVYLIQSAGIQLQRAPKRFLVVRKTITVEHGDKRATLSPAPHFAIRFSIEFDHPLIAAQRYEMVFSDRFFSREVSRARTFGFLREVEQLKAMGLARGGSLDNAVVIDDFNVVNEGGLRFPDEFVRHKVLDSLGDLAMIGMPVIGELSAHKSGHMLNHRLVMQLLADPTSHEVVEIEGEQELSDLAIEVPAYELGLEPA